MTLAAKAHGTLLARGGTTIAEVTSITGPGSSVNILAVTSMDSTAGVVEKIGGLLDEGEISFEMNYVPSNATHIALLAARTSTAQAFTLTFVASTDTISFNALVSAASVSAPVDGELTLSSTLAITGVVTYPT